MMTNLSQWQFLFPKSAFITAIEDIVVALTNFPLVVMRGVKQYINTDTV